MRIALAVLACLVGLAARAEAEDFTGVYAGVNAGYGFQSGDGPSRGIGVDAPRGGGGATAGAMTLPPSAREAARALQARNRSSQGASVPLR